MAAPTSKEAVLKCLNQTNGSNILLSDVTFSPVTAGNFSGKNTKIKLTATATGNYIGEKDYHYNRVEFTLLDLVGADLGQDYVLENGQTLADLVELINVANDTNITEDDVENWTAAIAQPTVTDPVSVTLTARSTSYAWIGNATISLSLSKPHIKTVAPTEALDGLLLSHLQA